VVVLAYKIAVDFVRVFLVIVDVYVVDQYSMHFYMLFVDVLMMPVVDE
jgi:hypothetical protein